MNLVDLFDGVTTVRKVRGSVKALCPFHAEKTPSLSIDPARGLYHCFGCGVGGDIFTFVQETQGVGFGEAVEVLADRAGIVVRKDPGAIRKRERRGRLLEVVEAAGRFYHSRLKEGSDAGHARAYVRGRDYDLTIVDQFRLGYAPESFDTLTGHLRDLGFMEREIEDAGMGRRSRRGRLFDQMRGRLMFPIQNVRGEMVGFGGRLLRGDGPKYLNTAETSLYKKSRLLYGLDLARSAISREQRAVVVEGYTDVIAFHLAEMPVAVATCGTALGEGHFDLLRRFAPRVVLAFDADAAGAGAAIRGDELKITSDLDLELRVAGVPDGRDPADLVQEGRADLLKEAVERSIPITEFRIDRILARHDLGEREARTRAMREATALIARHPDNATRFQYASYVASRTRMSEQLVLRAVSKLMGHSERPTRERRGEAVVRAPARTLHRAERELLRHLMAGTAPLEQVELDFFEDDRAHQLARWLVDSAARLEPGTPVQLSGIEDRFLAVLARELAMTEYPLEPVAPVLAHLEVRHLSRRKAELRARLDSLDRTRDSAEYSQTEAELVALMLRQPVG